MRHAGRGAARLLLVAAFAVAVTGEARRPRSKPTRVYRPNKDALELLKHVMLHEEEWTDVLQEPIKRLDEPPHKGRQFDAPTLGPIPATRTGVHSEEPVYNVHEIVSTVITHYGAIRSFAEYGAKALRRALACYTFKHVFFQSKSMSLMMSKVADPVVLLQTANELKKNASKFIDFLSAVPEDDLTLLLLTYWDVIKQLQYEGVQLLYKLPYPDWLIEIIDDLIRKVDEFLRSNCVPYETDVQFLKMTGISRKTPMLEDPTLEALTPLDDLIEVTRGQAEHMARTGRGMGIVTMSDHLWSSLFLYRGRQRPDSTRMDVEDPNAGNVSPQTSEAGPSDAPPTASVVAIT